MGKIIAVCVSREKGTQKHDAGEAELVAGHGIKGDAHAGGGHRQVSLLSQEKIDAFRAKGADVAYGAFGENLVASGIDFKALPVGTILRSGAIVMELTQIGKECHAPCQIHRRMGDCIMPREGVFAKVLHGGVIKTGDELIYEIEKPYRVGIITASDKCAKGEREDISGKMIMEIVWEHGYAVEGCQILPDEQELLEREMKRLCDGGGVDLLLTTGGTGLSKRDCMPEATLAVAERLVPGISEAMRHNSMAITKRAMLSRAVAAVRGKTLIVNLPGSPKAVRENLEYIIGELRHGLDILTGHDGECGG